MKKNILKIMIFILVIAVFFVWFYYYKNSWFTNKDKQNNEISNEISWNIENQFHISSVANSDKIQITYEPIDKERVNWPVVVDYQVFENDNRIKNWIVDYPKEKQPIVLNIQRKEDREYKIVSNITDKNWNTVNESILTINRLDSIKWDIDPQKQTLSFDQEVDYIKNNINDIVSNFWEKPANGNWYVVDIRFKKTDNIVAKTESWTIQTYTDALVIFEDGHYSYLVKLQKENGIYKPVGYYNFIQKPNQKVWWKQFWTDKALEVWEIIYHWSIDQ